MQIYDPRASELCCVQPAHAYLATLYALLGWKTTAKVLEVSGMRHITKFNNGGSGPGLPVQYRSGELYSLQNR